ncbi:NAD-dependent epimerase/dehydratase family protein [Salinibacter sp. 10B]|uniref:NAD-dependent epimerase/dehydratase family protein n=1 Tax=Salinibacter sp. 10B TaxID=1923971 RepID=UPI002157E131|nr:NAD-dependent epimerase/dehydratase family protein [Salinibacter sp. 10B]
MSDSKIAFVTGGTGFVGSHLVEELLRRGVSEIRCMVRSDPKWLSDLDVTYVHGDLSDVETLWTALDGVTHVYHLAGITRAPEWASFYEVNVQGTLNLLGAVKHAAPDVERILLTSSLAAVGRCDAEVATEEHPLRPVSRYGKSKAQMEAALRDAHDMTESYWEALPLTVVRPPAVYGPRDRDILDFFRAVQRHVCPVVGSGAERSLSLVHARDLARGMVEASRSSRAAGETYLLGGEQPYTWNEVKRAATDALNTWAVTLPVPSPVVGVVGTLAEAWGKLTGTYPPLNRDKAREIRHAITACSSQKAQKHFGYAPRIPLGEGVAETVNWYREQDWL